MPEAMDPAALAHAVAALDGWQGDTEAITRTVEAPTFLEGIDLVRRVAVAAEEANHHPDIDIRWRRVTFTLTTHDAGGAVSDLDIALARRIDALAAGDV